MPILYRGFVLDGAPPDNSPFFYFLAPALDKLGIEPHHFHNPEVLASCAEANPPDLVIINLITERGQTSALDSRTALEGLRSRRLRPLVLVALPLDTVLPAELADPKVGLPLHRWTAWDSADLPHMEALGPCGPFVATALRMKLHYLGHRPAALD